MQRTSNLQLENIEQLNNGAYAINCKFKNCYAVVSSLSNVMTTKILKILMKENGKVEFNEQPPQIDNRFQVKIKSDKIKDGEVVVGDIMIITDNADRLDKEFSKIIKSNQLTALGDKEIIYICQDGKIKYRASNSDSQEK